MLWRPLFRCRERAYAGRIVKVDFAAELWMWTMGKACATPLRVCSSIEPKGKALRYLLIPRCVLPTDSTCVCVCVCVVVVSLAPGS